MTTTAHTSHVAGAATIGPNAVIQTVAALAERYGREQTARLLAQIGRPELLDERPETLIDERRFEGLHADLWRVLGPAETREVMANAGALTAGYVMANRIPRPVRVGLRLLPRNIAIRLLLPAVAQHAWTFVGSGRFSFTLVPAPRLIIKNCITARNINADSASCAFYSAAFERLLRAMVDERLHVHESACAACGASCCTFTIEVA